MGVEKGGQESRSKMSEKRKSSKPIMEKRRRERINNSLNELKNLLLESRKKDSSCCSKLEKADILEMTVQHLKAMRSQQEKASCTNDPIALAHYRAGFNQSAAEISRYLINAQDIEVQVRTRLLTHLSNTCHAVLGSQHPLTPCSPTAGSPLFPTPTPVPKSPKTTSSPLKDPSSLVFHSSDGGPNYFESSQLQLVPATLTNGQLAAVLVPTGSTYASSLQAPLVSIQQPQLIPALSSSRLGDMQPDSQKTCRTDSSQSPTSPGNSTGLLWRPWRDG